MTDNITAVAHHGAYVRLDRRAFQRRLHGKQVDLYVLTNRNGLQTSLCNHGARIVQILAPDRHGQFGDVVLGTTTRQAY